MVLFDRSICYELGFNTGNSRPGKFPGKTHFPGKSFPGKQVWEFPFFGKFTQLFKRVQEFLFCYHFLVSINFQRLQIEEN